MMNAEFRNVLWLTVLLVLIAGCSEDEPVQDEEYPTSGLVSYYNFDNNMEDQMGNSPSGISYGGVGYYGGYRNQGLTFNGINGYVTIARESFTSTNEISASFWVKRLESGSLQFFLTCVDFSFGTKYYSITCAISITQTDNASAEVPSHTWTHVVGTYDGSDIRIYINGILEQLTHHPGSLQDLSADKLTIGYSTNYWKGNLDELFIYDRALTQKEVEQLYNR